MNNSNTIDSTAKIHPNINIGDFNVIGKNVVIDIVGDNPEHAKASIGDNNIINDNTRIIISGELQVGDWNVFHNDMLIMADKRLRIGHNCWFGQNTILDGTGGLVIGNGVRVGMYSQLWTHVASGERIEGCTLFSKNETIINNDVWLVGSCVVSSGIELGEKSIAFINSVITKDTLPYKTYSGTPAKVIEGLEFYKPVSLNEKFLMLKTWLLEFCEKNNFILEENKDDLVIVDHSKNEKVVFTKAENKRRSGSTFFLFDKTYNKTNINLERLVYKYIYNNKARFISN